MSLILGANPALGGGGNIEYSSSDSSLTLTKSSSKTQVLNLGEWGYVVLPKGSVGDTYSFINQSPYAVSIFDSDNEIVACIMGKCKAECTCVGNNEWSVAYYDTMTTLTHNTIRKIAPPAGYTVFGYAMKATDDAVFIPATYYDSSAKKFYTIIYKIPVDVVTKTFGTLASINEERTTDSGQFTLVGFDIINGIGYCFYKGGTLRTFDTDTLAWKTTTTLTENSSTTSFFTDTNGFWISGTKVNLTTNKYRTSAAWNDAHVANLYLVTSESQAGYIKNLRNASIANGKYMYPFAAGCVLSTCYNSGADGYVSSIQSIRKGELVTLRSYPLSSTLYGFSSKVVCIANNKLVTVATTQSGSNYSYITGSMNQTSLMSSTSTLIAAPTSSTNVASGGKFVAIENCAIYAGTVNVTTQDTHYMNVQIMTIK